MKKIYMVMAVALLIGGRAFAEVRLHALFSDNAVLQQGMTLPVWGTAGGGEKVTVTFAGQTAATTAKDGRWMVKLDPVKANATPQTVTVTGTNTIEVKNLLVGEVWICSGQSNMQFPLAKGSGWQNGAFNEEQVIRSSTMAQSLKLLAGFNVTHTTNHGPASNSSNAL
jgi:sialate O-acetylesterase